MREAEIPNIRENSAAAQIISRGLQPTEIGVDATAQAARRIGAFSNQSADAFNRLGHQVGGAIKAAGDAATDYMDHQQISAGAAKGAEVFDGLLKSKDEALKAIDPNDPLYGQRVEGALKQWKDETLAPALDKFREGFTTQKAQAWSEHFIEQTRTHMFNQSAADTATAAGLGIQNSIRTTANVASNTALRDPSSVPAQLDLVEHSIDGLVATSPVKGVRGAAIRSEVLEKTREQIVKSGAIGAIQKASDPEAAAQEWVAKYPQYINGAEAIQLAKAAKQQNRTNLLQQKELENYTRTQDVRRGEDELSKLKADSITYDENGHATVKPNFYKDSLAIEQRYGLHEIGDKADTYRRYAEAASRSKRETVVTDPATQKQLYDGLFDPDIKTQTTEVKIMDAAARGKLDPHATKTLLDLHNSLERAPLKGPVYQGAMEAAKGMVGANVMPDGHQRYANFLNEFVPAYLRLSPEQRPGALDTRNPESLISKSLEGQRPAPADLMKAYVLRRIGGAMPGEVDALPAPGKQPEAKRPVPPAAVQMLKNNPSMRGDFDAKYGAGSAAKILGQ